MIDALGDRMKQYEGSETNRTFIPLLPVIARLDGRSFSKLTKQLDKPFDNTFYSIMVNTAKFLLKETNADCAYVQSDEITLTWNQVEYKSQYIFNGKIFKMTSVIPSMASAFFNRQLQLAAAENSKFGILSTKFPHFDCRVFQVPNITEGANCFLWRYQDCTRNAISGISQQHFSHNELQYVSTEERIKMLEDRGIIIEKDYPPEFLYGTFIRYGLEEVLISQDIIDKLPEIFRPKDGKVVRSKIKIESLKFSQLSNRQQYVYLGESPVPQID